MAGKRTAGRGRRKGALSRAIAGRFRRLSESGTTYIEIAIITVIVTISLMAITNAIRVATRGALMYKERTRALALAQDKMEEVKRMGYDKLKTRVSRYQWPTYPDPASPLSQDPKLLPYPVPAPAPGEDPWSVEPILSGQRSYYRHVKVKCVEEVGGLLQQKPTYAESPPGGTDTSSNLMQIEVDITWFSKATWKMEQARVAGLLANTRPPVVTEGRISGTVFDATTGLPMTGKKLVVYTTNLGTGDSFSDTVDQGKGTYSLYPLPLGEYTVKLAGAPQCYDSAHASTAVPVPPGTIEPILIDAGNLTKNSVSIYTKPAVAVRVAGLFVGGDPGDEIMVESGDGTSSSTRFMVGVYDSSPHSCTAGNPCSFYMENVGWAVSGIKPFTVAISNKTKNTFGRGTICMDAAAVATATTFYWGYGAAPPFDPPPTPYTPATCGACGAVPCQDPANNFMLSATAFSSAGATVFVDVVEYFNGAYAPLAKANVFINDGNSTTVMTGTSGTAFIAGVKPSNANALKVKVWMSTTGYTTDEWTLAFDVADGGNYYLPEGSTGDPGTCCQHKFVLKRVSSVSGTTWKLCDGGSPPCGPASEGMAGVTVSLTNNQTGFSQVVTTDSGGKFVFPNVPVENYDYTLVPSGGGDMLSNPLERQIKVPAHGLSIRTDSTGGPNQFVLTVVNGVIAGRVLKGGLPYTKGALVYATTYAGTFPATIPSVTLSGYHTYSTITRSDGTYTLKVATGVGNYIIHVFSPDNPTAPVDVAVGAGQPAAGATVNAADAVIP